MSFSFPSVYHKENVHIWYTEHLKAGPRDLFSMRFDPGSVEFRKKQVSGFKISAQRVAMLAPAFRVAD